jgi:predicted alpha-1,2-mannosidase
MKKLLLNLLLLLSLPAAADEPFATFSPVDYVNPFIDSHKSRWFFFCSASRPFGMVSLSPDTQTEGSWMSGYLYDSLHVRCFSHIHAWQMSGVAVMPTTGEFCGHLGMDGYQSAFNHEDEIAKPGYHKIYLSDYKTLVELTSTTRVGFHQYTFPKSNESYVLFDIGAYLGHGPKAHAEAWQAGATDIAGFEIMAATHRRPKDTPVYFYATFENPFDEIVTWKNGKIEQRGTVGMRISGSDAGLAVKYNTSEGEKIRLKVAISYVSVEQAKRNLEAELADWDFERVKQASFDEWNAMLGRIKVEGGTHERTTKFYTDLWHALLGRHITSDADGYYMDMTGDCPRVRRVALDDAGRPRFPHHNFDALWGSQWSLNILWSMAYPEVMDAFCNTMIDMYRDGGMIPRGPSGGNYTYVMIGDQAAPFFACAWNKGIRGYDGETMYEGLRKNAFPGGIRDHAGYEHRSATGGGMTDYVALGFVPQDKPTTGGHSSGAVSMTLEYAYQDWCLAQLAKSLGKTDDYELFMRRSQNYHNHWNPQSGYMQPRYRNSAWTEGFAPVGEGFATTGFVESNSAIYTYFVPQDIKGLITLFGGNKKFTERLNSQFEKAAPNRFVTPHGQHSENWVDYENQPATHLAHLFSHAAAPWLTQHWVRRVKTEAFGGTSPYDGYLGDEDQGQMGALGTLMAIGLFEDDGGASINPSYEITSPLFNKITIYLNNDYYKGEKFVIKTKNDTEKNIYIQKTTLNGRPLKSFHFPHSVFADGGELEIVLGEKPNKQWGIE